MCIATRGATPRLDPDLRTPATQMGAILRAVDTVRSNLQQQQQRVASLDPDLKSAYQRANRRRSTKGQAVPLAPVQMQAQQDIFAEQKRRDELRAQYEKAEQAANDQLKQIAEQQKQAEQARLAEAERQAQLQRDIEQARVAQQQRIAQERTATQAASASMQVLGAAGPAGAAPSAAVSKPGQRRGRARQTSGTQTLRIGTSGQGPGVGLNIGG
jgi:hypothetical protein